MVTSIYRPGYQAAVESMQTVCTYEPNFFRSQQNINFSPVAMATPVLSNKTIHFSSSKKHATLAEIFGTKIRPRSMNPLRPKADVELFLQLQSKFKSNSVSIEELG